jgi:hypothetical protein
LGERAKKRQRPQWLPLTKDTRAESRLLTLTLLPCLDLAELGKRAFKFVVEEPHCIKNFTEGCRCPCSVSLSEGEDAIVPQILHDRLVGNTVFEQIA